MKHRLLLLFALLSLSFFYSAPVHAAALSDGDVIYLKADMDFLLWEPKVSQLKSFSDFQKTSFAGLPIKPLKGQEGMIEAFSNTETVQGIDLAAIQSYLWQNIVPEIERKRSDVTIDMDEEGKISFDRIGLSGRTLDVEKAAHMIAHAIETGVKYVNLPIIREEPIVTVKNEKLKEMGIKEVIGVGFTDYGHSSSSRIHNIAVGLAKFNGHLIAPNEELSFTTILGPVESYTGYLPELVIKGDRTEPDYGGGLCQVSSTAYRAALASGFPITDRRNHSYVVNYYKPVGLDATVYIPNPDLKFINESPGYVLIQTYTVRTEVYYVFYGTKNNRKANLIGPFVHSYGGYGPSRHEYTSALPPGVKRVLQNPAPEATISWYHYVEYPKKEREEKGTFGFLDEIYSKYQAKGLFIEEGGAAPGGESVSPE